MKGNVIVGQSGGPTAVINSSLAGVIKACWKHGIRRIYGMHYGIEGFLNEDIVDIEDYITSGQDLSLLKRTPSSFLGTCRYKLPPIEGNEKLYEKIFDILDKKNIEYFLYNGGNDSMDTIKMLADYAETHQKKQKFMGIPKTIDNDLPMTDHCPGLSEGLRTADGKFVCELGTVNDHVDAFGHKQLAGTAAYLASLVTQQTGLKSRYIEFSSLQRCAAHLASRSDSDEAYNVGYFAAKAAFEGNTGKMVTIKVDSREPYVETYDMFDIHEVANVERKVPLDWITNDGTYVSDEYLKYARPFIIGRVAPYTAGGLPIHLTMTKKRNHK